MTSTIHPVITKVTERIRHNSNTLRQAYLLQVKTMRERAPSKDRLGCANLAHAWAALPGNDKLRVRTEKAPNLAIVTAFNDMLSAHQPYEGYPTIIKEEARRCGVTAQVAGGVPAMCDGITQGYPGMELSLFSRDVIAMSTAVSLSHDVFDGALLLGICDKIVPGLLIGALHFGHLPCIFIPAGPMVSGLSNKKKAAVREQFAKGQASRADLLDAENAAYHAAGTCTFYGTANSNQMLLEAMGLHLPNAAFIHPNTPEREQYTRHAVQMLAGSTGHTVPPIGELVDEECIVNAMIALLATGGSTNHLIHWVAVARSAGIVIDWSDFDDLSHIIPLLARIYPNGSADVNDFQAAGGPQRVISELVEHGLMHPLERTVTPTPYGGFEQAPLSADDNTVLRGCADPFSPSGGLRLLQGNLGRSVIKVSAVADEHQRVRAPAMVFEHQEEVAAAFKAGQLNKDLILVMRYQGPKANGMPELHKLTPVLSILQDNGFKVALVTDGRMSGASGKVPAAIHLSPEALDGGVLSLVQDGDIINLDAVNGILSLEVSDDELKCRQPKLPSAHDDSLGRALFKNFRASATCAEQGACTWL